MKNICKTILALALCICLAISFVGCDTYSYDLTKNCGGIIKSLSITERYYEIEEGDILWGEIDSNYYPELTVTYDISAVNYYFPTLTVSTADFTTYKCHTLQELLQNSEYKEYVVSYFGSLPVPYEYVDKESRTYKIMNKRENLAYTLYYNKLEAPPTFTYADLDLNKFIGFINYN
ncbi:MAG: hypothetical protein K2K80_05580 [Clostridia bacterium]|nr:hypothetical protein [Clostridia bacterium]